jgi:hypothetical protein
MATNFGWIRSFQEQEKGAQPPRMGPCLPKLFLRYKPFFTGCRRKVPSIRQVCHARRHSIQHFRQHTCSSCSHRILRDSACPRRARFHRSRAARPVSCSTSSLISRHSQTQKPTQPSTYAQVCMIFSQRLLFEIACLKYDFRCQFVMTTVTTCTVPYAVTTVTRFHGLKIRRYALRTIRTLSALIWIVPALGPAAVVKRLHTLPITQPRV